MSISQSGNTLVLRLSHQPLFQVVKQEFRKQASLSNSPESIFSRQSRRDFTEGRQASTSELHVLVSAVFPTQIGFADQLEQSFDSENRARDMLWSLQTLASTVPCLARIIASTPDVDPGQIALSSLCAC